MSRLVIGSRGSALARWQAQHIAAELQRLHPGLEVALEIIVTSGDRFTSGPLVLAGGKGLWVKELELALLAGTIDLAVHSLKDVPSSVADGLVLTAIPRRADPRDALVARAGKGLDHLAPGSVVGTSSLRRECQLRVLRPDLRLEVLRGNVDTRLRKVAEGQVDAAVLACAGLDRLGLGQQITERFSTERMLPAIGQGALAVETRVADARVRGLCGALADPEAEVTIAAERALLAGLGAGCRTPLGGHATARGAELILRALVGRPDGSEILREEVRGTVADAIALGAACAERLLRRGADRILAQLESPT